MTFRIGVDVGGTFTDVYLQNSESGQVWLAKTPTTPADQSEGVLAGITIACHRAGISLGHVDAVIHGTTVATNAVLEGNGARVGLLVSQGWRHMLHLGNSWTPGPLFGFFSYEPPEPLIPYERIAEIPGRFSVLGDELVPFDDAATRLAIEYLLDHDVDSITVSLLNAYSFPRHEQRARQLAVNVLKERGIELSVSISSDVSPEYREYERTVTTVMNSYLGPVMELYLSRLEDRLKSAGVNAPIQIVRSDGGLMSVLTARQNSVQTALSGPAGGVSGAAFVAKRAGAERVMTFDMGGTSSDVAVCIGGAPSITREAKVGAFPVRISAVDVRTIGAGGGSIADVSEVTGALRVGPRSAGAVPGPACYGRGGTLPTVTDANVVLGHLPSTLLGGDMLLDVDAAHRAIESIATRLEVPIHRAAQAIVDIVNGNMLGALRVVSVQRGLNPRDFALLSFGGAGGLHSNALAAELGCFPVIVPPETGVLSALGFIVADVRQEFSTSISRDIENLGPRELENTLVGLRERGTKWLTSEGVVQECQRLRHVLDMRYRGQGYELAVELADLDQGLSIDALAILFNEAHERLYGFALPSPIELVVARVQAIGLTTLPKHSAQTLGGSDSSSAIVDTQVGWIDDSQISIPVYERSLLQPGMQIPGKAIVQQYDGTTLILPSHIATVDPWLNLRIEQA